MYGGESRESIALMKDRDTGALRRLPILDVSTRPPQAAEANFTPSPPASNAQPWLWGVEATEAKQSRLGEQLSCNSAKQSSLRPDPPVACKSYYL